MTDPSPSPIRLLLVDDHEVVRAGLRTLLSRSGDMKVVGEAKDVASAVEQAVRLMPDLVLMDVRLPDGSGIDACREIRSRCPDTRVLFLTSYPDEEAVLATILAGASGYLLKAVTTEALSHAIKSVASGQSILDPALTHRMVTQVRSVAQPGADVHVELSPQEGRVLALVAEGRTNKEIAVALNLSEKTVKNYLSNVFQKLQVSRRSQAVAAYLKRSPPSE